MSGPLPTLRSGLPRRPGGGPWPPANTTNSGGAQPEAAMPQVAAVQEQEAPRADPTPVPTPTLAQDLAAAKNVPTLLRSGLPRTAGGVPWPAKQPQRAAGGAASIEQPTQHTVLVDPAPESQPAPEPITVSPLASTAASTHTATRNQGLRQGLPRQHGGHPWPEVSQVQLQVTDAVVPNELAAAPAAEPAQSSVNKAAEAAVPEAAAAPQALAKQQEPTDAAALPGATTTATASLGARVRALLATTPGKAVVAAAILLVFAAAAVLGSRWYLGTDSGQAFLLANPGEYHLPEMAPVGFPAWLGWQHFMNAFLMVLIIRSGLQIRGEKRPTAYWTSKRGGAQKVSLTVWFHQSLDLLWLINGAVFLVLLFATGQWVRVIPSSWEVFPNALSAGLQYLSLDWPTDNGWVNYNALQQLAYFTTIFVAAPLAAASGFRMSGLWPKRAKKLSALYPIEVARKIHVPVMVYFVVFIAIHVILVMATGALRNLNHMYAAQGSVDPSVYADNWFGFWMFVLSLVVIVGGVIAARPMVLAPIASVFGKVSSR